MMISLLAELSIWHCDLGMQCDAKTSLHCFTRACVTPESTAICANAEPSEKPLPTGDGGLGGAGSWRAARTLCWLRRHSLAGNALLEHAWKLHGSCTEAHSVTFDFLYLWGYLGRGPFHAAGRGPSPSHAHLLMPPPSVPHSISTLIRYPSRHLLRTSPSLCDPKKIIPTLAAKTPVGRPGRNHLSRAFVSPLGATINMRNCPALGRALGRCQSRSHHRQLCLLRSSCLGFDPDLDSLASSTATRHYMGTSSITIQAPSRSTAIKARSPFPPARNSTLRPTPTSPIWLPLRPPDPSPPERRGKGPG